jgi:hypothetical protein
MKGRGQEQCEFSKINRPPLNPFRVYEKQFTVYVFLMYRVDNVCSSAAFDAQCAELTVW